MAATTSSSSPKSVTIPTEEEEPAAPPQDPPSPDTSTIEEEDARAISSISDANEENKELSYFASQESVEYKSAKELLNQGDFEAALETIEQGIRRHLQDLSSSLGLKEEEAAVHPCLAPFHYLYGTTLLYSLEEASADDAMVVVPSESNKDEDPAEQEDNNAPEQQEDNNGDDNNNNNTEDIQIAYENLDTSRVLLQRYLLADDQSILTLPQRSQLSLDLAQVFCREGDLRRLQGHYLSAAQDYEQCLTLRLQYSPQNFRSLADVQYHLALTYSLLVVSQNGNLKKDEDEQPEDEEVPLSREDVDRYRRQSLEQYLACAQTLVCHLAREMGVPPPPLLSQPDASVSVQLAALRQSVRSLATTPTAKNNNNTEVLDWLDEIQETVDEMPQAEVGLKQIQRQTVLGSTPEEEDSTTTPPTTTAFFGSAAATALTASAMVVRSKKKRPQPEEPIHDDPPNLTRNGGKKIIAASITTSE